MVTPSAFSMQRSVRISFFNNKEFESLEALQTENTELKAKIALLETKISKRCCQG